ncbi:hypothetical protein E1262_17980 [Jiangella aurantiaca]|uniref:TPM domain-containing protein n=1 Tax=Jiangella aurantiaca TaxID=2530373 RepID=A0A4R5A6W9_9ACTN|nr:hypothetical protein [Jiangella aurantiaca]TDD67721.1 hypothetical protein E1262_17980 [Jiangella aurantiaca]
MRLTLPAAALLVVAATVLGPATAASTTSAATTSAAPAASEPAPGGYPGDVAMAWASAPVYVDETQASIVSADDAERLADRVDGHSPAVYIAVVPATALSDMPGGDDDARGAAFLDAVHEAGGPDGVYVVVFGGTATYGAAYDVDAPVQEALETAIERHTRSQQVAILDDTLTELGVSGAPEEFGGAGWVWPLVIAVVVLALAAGGLFWWHRRRTRDGGEGPALYRPSFDVLDDEADSLAERRELAREDVTRFGEELDAADAGVTDPTVAADVQAAMDAYAEAGAAVDGTPDDHVLRAVRATVEYGRWRLACAQARLAGRPLPARRADCFFDQRHGVSVTDWQYTPPGGRAREVPVCAACRDRLAGAAR